MKEFYMMDSANASMGKSADIQFMDSVTPIKLSKVPYFERWEVICEWNSEVNTYTQACMHFNYQY